MQTECQVHCYKLKDKVDFSPGVKIQNIEKSQKSGATKSIISNRRGPSQSPKSVHIGDVTTVKEKDSFRQGLRDTKNSSEISTSARDYGKNSHTSVSGGTSIASKNSPQVQLSNGKSERTNDLVGSENRGRKESPIKYDKMSTRGRVSATESETQDPQWNSSSHDPCPPTCPMTEARERAIKKAELRQKRLDDYLLNKGFRYFDDICTCSSWCLIKQLRRDKFVQDILTSVCLFGLGVKLCDELDAWNLFG